MGIFWYEDPSVLLNLDIIPTLTQTPEDQLNALTRFSLLLGVLVLLYRKGHPQILLYTTFVPVAMIFYYYYFILPSDDRLEENYDDPERPCRLPTPNNPFMNVRSTDYSGENELAALPACEIADPKVKDEVDRAIDLDEPDRTLTLEQQFYLGVDDLYQRQALARHSFHPVNATVPIDADGTARRWVYGITSSNCKSNQSQCTPAFRSFNGGRKIDYDLISRDPVNLYNN